MQAMKFKVHNEAHHKAIMEKLFELGCKWLRGGRSLVRTSQPFLYVSGLGNIQSGKAESFFQDCAYAEATLDELYKLKQNKIIKLNQEHTATILEKERVVRVGCKKFSFAKIEELHEIISTL